MKLDEAILDVLERDGPGTVKDISEGLSRRVYDALKRLVKDKKVKKDGHPGKGNEKYYYLPEPPPVSIKRRF